MSPKRISRARARSAAGDDIQTLFSPTSRELWQSSRDTEQPQGADCGDAVAKTSRPAKRRRTVIDSDDEEDSQSTQNVPKTSAVDGTVLENVKTVDGDASDYSTSVESPMSKNASRARTRRLPSNVEHIGRALSNVTLKKIVSASIPKTEADSNNIMAPVDGDVLAAMYSKYPTLSIKAGRDFTSQVKEIDDSYALMAENSLEDAEKVCGKLADALNRWPKVDDISYGRRGKTVRQATNALFDAAVTSVCPHAPIKAKAPSVTQRKDTRRWCMFVYIPFINSKTWASDRVRIELSDVTGDISEPKNLILNYKEDSGYEGKGDGGSFRSAVAEATGVDETVVEGLKRAEKYLRFMIGEAARIPRVSTLPSIRKWENSLRTPHRPEEFKQPALYGDQQLTNHMRHPGGINIYASRPLQQNSSGKWPNINIQSWDVNWAVPVLRAGDNCFMSTNDPFEAWKVMAVEADDMNHQLRTNPLRFSCSCPDPQTSTEQHCCARCAAPKPCSDLRPGSFDLRQCLDCIRTHPDRDRMATKIAVDSLDRVLRKEFRKRQWSLAAEGYDETLAAGQAKIRNDLESQSGTAYKNAFSDDQVQVTPVQRHILPSIDAVFPYDCDDNRRALLHTSTNIVVVPLALNLLKHIQLPITVQKIASFCKDYARLAEKGFPDHSPTGGVDAVTLQDNLIRDCDRLTLIRINAGWKVKDREGKSITDRMMKYLREEWISGKHRPGQPRTDPIRRLVSKPPTFQPWSAEDRRRIKKIAAEIEHWTAVTLPKASGCPYFCHMSTMPPDWSWTLCQQLMETRLARMTNWCNAKWDTVDTAETIFLECLFQACIGRMIVQDNDAVAEEKRRLRRVYGEFLDLPLSVYHHNPLTFAVAHRVHGQQMRTGWPEGATSLQDRLDGDHQNNILVETRTSNFLKHDFDPVYYPALLELVKNVRMPNELVDESMPMTPYNKALEGQLDREEFKDEDDCVYRRTDDMV